MTLSLPRALVDYLAQRDADRAAAVTEVLAGLTPREYLLVKEAAVMGYVQGLMRSEGDHGFKDSAVLGRVIDGCLSHSDLYPTISNHQEQP